MFRLTSIAVFLLMPWCIVLCQNEADCSDPLACNFTTESTGTSECDYCSCALDTASFFTLSVEAHATNIIEGQTTYRVYLNTPDPTDVVSAVFGSNLKPLSISTTTGFYNSTFGGATGADIQAFALGTVPELSADSWVTIGVEDNSSGTDISTLESPNQPWVACFSEGSVLDGNDFVIDDVAGGGWFVLGTSPNGIAGDDQRVLLQQITTAGTLTGTLNVQIFPFGDGDVRNTYVFNGEGVYFDDSLPACGCTDSAACNYDTAADSDDGSCTYPGPVYACDGSCLNDVNTNGICDELEVSGCSYTNACNFNPFATEDDGSCQFPNAGYDCSGNCLYDVDSDGVCDQNEITGCQDSAACNYSASATDAGYCDYPDSNYDCSGACLNDADNDGICDEFEVAGCTDSSACNYASAATDDDGSCTHATAGYACDGSCLLDSDSDGVCDQNEVTGCQDSAACNYSASATDAGYCDYPEANYDCSGGCLNDADSDGVCDEFEVAGCTDSTACNYASAATDDDGSCTYATAGYACDGSCLVSDVCGVCGGSGFDLTFVAETYGADQGVWQRWLLGIDQALALAHQAELELAIANNLPLVIVRNGEVGTFGIYNVLYNGNGISPDLAILELTELGSDEFTNHWIIQNTFGGSVHPGTPFTIEGVYCDCDGTLPVPYANCTGACANDADGDGVCDESEVAGCTDESACNYDPTATDDDGSCAADVDGPVLVTQAIEIELDENGEAFIGTAAVLAEAVTDDCGDVLYTSVLQTDFDCSHLGAPVTVTVISEDSNNNMSYATVEVTVVDPNGYCDSAVMGCTYESATNYDPDADSDDGTCEFDFGTGGGADGCADLDADGLVGSSDLLLLLAGYGSLCE